MDAAGATVLHGPMVNRVVRAGLVPVVLLGATPLLTGCGSSPSAQDVGTQLARQIAAGDVTGVAGAAAQQDLTAITKGMDGLHPGVTATGVQQQGDAATVTLHYSWPLASRAWTYDTTARLQRQDKAWHPVWTPSVVQSQLDADTRLVHQQAWPRRADITGDGNAPLMTYRPVLRLGINKPGTNPGSWASSAAALAAKVGIDARTYQARVAAAGPQAFVEALTVRGDNARDAPDITHIPGATELADQAVIGPAKGFAAGILGTVGPATAEQVSASKGQLTAGALTGQSGLEARYDAQLRGTPGDSVAVRPRTGSATGTTVFSTDAKPGTPLRTTLSLEAQEHAEKILSGQRTPAALVAIDPATGDVRAAATGAANAASADATTGRYAPGSTFKAVTALALLRSGMTPDSQVNCTPTVTVDGRTFKNYDDFPAARVGRMPLREAIALSCNTALIAEHARIDAGKLRAAAASLGVGQDMDAGLPAFFGSVPDPSDTVAFAASMIGQGTVEVSPLAMATVAASVAAGHTVHPVIVPDHTGSAPSAAPLTTTEATQLRTLLHAVVTDGSGRMLAGLADGAKTGTAEYGTDTPPRTHAWMIAYNSTTAAAVMVFDGDTGSGTAGPLLKAYLS